MAKKGRPIRALHPATAPPVHPSKETVVIHTTREKHRNAGGGSMADKGVILPLAGGIAGGAATVLATAKFGWHPVAVAAAATAGGIALASAVKTPWMKQAAMGAAIGAGTLGGVTLVGQFLNKKSEAAQAHAASKKDAHRSADGDGFVTRQELQDALAKLADNHKEVQKQQSCDLLTALRDEIRKTMAEPKPVVGQTQAVPFLHTVVAPARSAYGERDSGDDYLRNAYGDEPRNQFAADDYARNAYGDERDAVVYDERDANVYDERDANVYDERDAAGEERDAEAEA